MNRRKFIKATAATTALGLAGIQPLIATPKPKRITILHTNDVHSRIEAFDKNHKRNGGMGGFSQRATLINKIRKEEEHVILLDSGDIFQGTPYFNFFGGELEFKLMSLLKYDVATLGNHDFDNGMNGFVKQLPHAKFDFVSANYDFKNTDLESLIKPYKIINRGGIKIGIFGLGIKLNGLVDPRLYKETKYHDPIEVAKDMTHILKDRKKCDLVICLSHLGYKYKHNKVSDQVLAQKTHGIDLILGGHTHTFLNEPQEFTNSQGKTVLINQVGWAGLFLGRIDFELNPITNEKLVSNFKPLAVHNV